MFEKTKALCDSFLEVGIPGFDLMVCHEGKCVLRYFGGVSDKKNQIPITGKEKYNIYSCSKPITCVAVMQLWEKGLFQLDDLLSDYMPEFANMTVRQPDGTVKPAQNPIRIHNLFEMTAGFNYDYKTESFRQLHARTYGRCPTREFARTLATEPLDFEPGAQYQYSLCHDVLAALVEVLTGQLFHEYVKENIFDPLGMKDSDFLLPIEDYVGVAQLYRYDKVAEEVIVMDHGNVPLARIGSEHASGGGGCVSTVEDYMKFLEALRVGDVILKKDTIRLMRTNRLNEAQKATFNLTKLGYGYGLGMRTPDPDNGIYDFGWSGAAGAYLAIDPYRDVTVYYSMHVMSSPVHSKRRRVIATVMEDLFSEKSGLDASLDAQLNALPY
ncbi:MAG: beta-lactamase family protein [Oscillospiraceae bacterium]|nr:beta-lactamase family protein [Oscillospiraceae bacterium]